MKIVLKSLLLLILAGFPVTALLAQQDILSACGDATGSNGTVSWSVGLVAYSTWSESTGTLTEGVQQPYEIFNITGLEEITSDPGFIVFPNPTTGKVTVKFSTQNLNDLSYRIYDMKGTRLRIAAIDAAEVTIPMDDLKAATYFLVILEKNQPVNTYKIIKK